MTKKKPITSTAHAKSFGTCCPSCGSHDIVGDSVETSEGHAWQEMSCEECGATWNDLYKLTGYDNLQIN